MVPRCSTTCRGEYRRVMPSNRGLASHLAVSAISDSNPLTSRWTATSESNRFMTNSCPQHCCAACDLKNQALCDAVPPRPEPFTCGQVRQPPSSLVQADIGQINTPRRPRGSRDLGLSIRTDSRDIGKG